MSNRNDKSDFSGVRKGTYSNRPTSLKVNDESQLHTHDIIIQRMYNEGIPRSRISEYKLANKLYKWQRKNKPCLHGFTKICAKGCFWTERHRANMERVVEREVKS